MKVRCSAPATAKALAEVPGQGLIFVADPTTGDGWPEVLAELTEAFDLAQNAARSGDPVVFVVANDDLLGRNGPGRAMVATGLLSAARTAALEQIKTAVPVNVIAIEDGVDLEALVRWCRRVSEPAGVVGELIHLGHGHLGKSLP